MKKALALMLVVIALFSVLTIAASAEAKPINDEPIIIDKESVLNVYFNLTDTLNAIGNWVEGVGTFLARVFLEPIRLILEPIVGFEVTYPPVK